MIYYGESWKKADDKPAKPQGLTRAEQQARVGRQYADGEITLATYRTVTDRLSQSDASGMLYVEGVVHA